MVMFFMMSVHSNAYLTLISNSRLNVYFKLYSTTWTSSVLQTHERYSTIMGLVRSSLSGPRLSWLSEIHPKHLSLVYQALCRLNVACPYLLFRCNMPYYYNGVHILFFTKVRKRDLYLGGTAILLSGPNHNTPPICLTTKAPFQYKYHLSQVWDSHVKNKTVARPSYL